MMNSSQMMRAPQDWLPHVHSDRVYWLWAPDNWSRTSPLSKGSFFALQSPGKDILVEVFVLGVGSKPNAAGLVEGIMKKSLFEDHHFMRVIREGSYQLEEFDVSNAISRMYELNLMDTYGFVTEMGPATSCHRLIVEYAEKGTSVNSTTDCFFLNREELVLQLNMKTFSSSYSKLARTFEQVANSARLGRFA